jgi:hypothetical protein
MTFKSDRFSNRLVTESYVPYQLSRFNFYFLTAILASIISAKVVCGDHYDLRNAQTYRHPLRTSEHDLFDSTLQDSPSQFKLMSSSNEDYSSNVPTPPLISSLRNKRQAGKPLIRTGVALDADLTGNKDLGDRYRISPHGVLKASDPLGVTENELFSPTFDHYSADPQQYMQQDSIPPNNPFSEGNYLDSVESGSGLGYDSAPSEKSDDSSTSNDYLPTPSVVFDNPFMTPIFGQVPRQQISDNAPILMKRLPRLFGTAGTPWRYKIPSSTFQDEDGDLRYLRSSLIMKQFIKSEYKNDIETKVDEDTSMKNLQWLQYDQSTQTLFGFPTEDDIGLNTFLLVVSDRWGSSSNETIKIAIRPHQSSKAITHSIKINGIRLANPGRSSIPEILTDLVKSITEGVFLDRSTRNMIIQSYKLTASTPGVTSEQIQHEISIAWFNSSLPIHPCDLTSIESIFKALIDNSLLPPDWSLLSFKDSVFSPSQILMKSLSPDFKPSNVSINLLGACESKRSNDNAYSGISLETGPKIKSRIGKMKWKLGQPIMYRIPQDTFLVDNGLGNTRNLSLTLHTIDGKTLDQDPMYSFLDFEQETQTIFGLSYDLTRHVGSRELLLTAKHLPTQQRIRETFIIDIESQDLTTINNRAFRVSLYFMTRMNIFGPREQVMLTHRMITALNIEDVDRESLEYADFTVINIQKFTIGSYIDNSATLSDPANSWKYQDKILPLNEPDTTKNSEPYNTRDGIGSDGTIFYKLTWTNETIGYRGDCPVEVIKENILYTLERKMIDYIPPNEEVKSDDLTKNDSVKFYDNLRAYFEPSIDLIHLRFEPMSACIDAIDLHDVGNSDLADIVDKAEDLELTTEALLPTLLTKPPEVLRVKEVSPINSDEYWAIVVLIILVVAIFFVVMMLIMGLHTYRINQEKRFELQMKLAQARQNSMYLSSMVLADQIQPNDIVTQQSNVVKPTYMDDGTSRKPIILDDEKQILANGSSGSHLYKPTTVKITGQSVQTTSLKPNMTFTMDSIAQMQNSNNLVNMCPEMMANQQIFIDDRQRSMTLNRRPTESVNHPITRPASANHLSHSQSIITVASVAPQVSFVQRPQGNVPIVYAPMPVFYETAGDMPYDL